ncbi:MAG: deoxyribodipyrimidine photo-lyase, partial [Flavobacteriales bacterium]
MSTLYWFRNDLRLEDNPALIEALKSGNELVPVFVFEERWWETDEWGFKKTGAFRTQFLLESVADLQKQLKAVGSNLLIRKGNT